MNKIYHFENVSALEQTEEAELEAPISTGSGKGHGPIDATVPAGEEKILQEPQELRLVLGIDYGTTFSGAECSLEEIDVIEQWGPQMDNEEKVPSVISYSRSSQAGEQQWGKSLSADAVTMIHTKLELGVEDLLGELDMTLQVLDGMKNLNFDEMMLSKGQNDLPPYSHKSPEEIVTDYLEKLFAYVQMEVRVDENNVFAKHTTTDIVVTIPTDVVSYRVTQRSPTLELEQIGKPTGSRCGSIFINLEFKKWLRMLLGEEEYLKLDPNLDIDKNANHASETPAMRELMQAFDDVKKQFAFSTPDVRFSLRGELENLDIFGKVNKGLITIPQSTMRGFFDSCIKEIVELIWEHVDRIEERGSRPKHLFLVGGFGASEYLKYRLKETITEEEMQMSYRQPKESWTAVVRGAVVCGIEKDAIPNLRRTDVCRHNYAVCFDQLYSNTFHVEKDMTQIHGATYAQSQLTWLLNKGDLVLSDQPRKEEVSFQLTLRDLSAGKTQLEIFRNSDDEDQRPRRYQNAKEGRSIRLDLHVIGH
ncbi:hypothetical protein J4E90_000595 [Alternaria incomplexa]|uniref:uncharacterized protein n=1 Tax=Alternaria incomplexa TaxID=1187928 RepID=UPI00221EEE16|nr:uncharacterized protein J4E90_000595 [Alternaria incomplexa]KAI4922167.1 hypothetical protein J4E90_000595 [Alternaria incomplexa]